MTCGAADEANDDVIDDDMHGADGWDEWGSTNETAALACANFAKIGKSPLLLPELRSALQMFLLDPLLVLLLLPPFLILLLLLLLQLLLPFRKMLPSC